MVLHGDKTSRVVFQFGNTTARSTRRHVNETQVFLCPYSYSSVLRLVVEIENALDDIDTFKTDFYRMPRGHSDEVKSIMKFLEAPRLATSETGCNGETATEAETDQLLFAILRATTKEDARLQMRFDTATRKGASGRSYQRCGDGTTSRIAREGREELIREYSLRLYWDVDGKEQTWLENDICPWDYRSLQYLQRARELDTLDEDSDKD